MSPRMSGIYPSMDAEEYFSDPCPAPSLSASIAKVILNQSPAHARLKHPRLNPAFKTGDEKHNNDREIGSAYHAMFLGAGADVEVIDAADWKKPANRDDRAALQAEGKIVLLAHQRDTVAAMVEAASHQLVDRGYGTAFDAGSAETCLICSVGPDWFRRLVDWYTPTMIWDMKTTGNSAAPDEVGNMMFNQGWPVDAAMTDFILNVLDPDNAGRREHLFVVQENYAPYALTVVRLSEAAMTWGRHRLQRAIDTWSQCMAPRENDPGMPWSHPARWPGYPTDTLTPDIPAWAMKGEDLP